MVKQVVAMPTSPRRGARKSPGAKAVRTGERALPPQMDSAVPAAHAREKAGQSAANLPETDETRGRGRAFTARWRPRALRRRPDGSRAEQPDFAPRGVGELLPGVLTALGGDAARLRLVQLWRHWEMVLGPELAPLARPLGHHGDCLRIGAEDAMLMQELHLQSGEILERVNAFMEGPFFACVKVSLGFRRTELDTIAPPPTPPPQPLERPRVTGEALAHMRPDSPVARCYARYVGLARAGQEQDSA